MLPCVLTHKYCHKGTMSDPKNAMYCRNADLFFMHFTQSQVWPTFSGQHLVITLLCTAFWQCTPGVGWRSREISPHLQSSVERIYRTHRQWVQSGWEFVCVYNEKCSFADWSQISPFSRFKLRFMVEEFSRSKCQQIVWRYWKENNNTVPGGVLQVAFFLSKCANVQCEQTEKHVKMPFAH